MVAKQQIMSNLENENREITKSELHLALASLKAALNTASQNSFTNT